MNNQIAIIALDTQPIEIVTFDYVEIPIQSTRNATISDTVIPNRSHPIVHYGGGTDEMSIKVAIVSSGNGKTILDNINRVKSFTYSDNKTAQRIQIVLGNAVKSSDVWILRKVSSTISLFDDKGYPKYGTLELGFSMHPNTNLKRNDVL